MEWVTNAALSCALAMRNNMAYLYSQPELKPMQWLLKPISCCISVSFKADMTDIQYLYS